MHALVTGGGGFLGSYIVEALLARGDRVRVFSRGHYPKLEQAGAQVVRGDLRDNAALAAVCDGIECVFHTAALPGIGSNRDEYVAVNRTGTELLLSNARQRGVQRFIYTSSPSVVFAGRDQLGIDESAPYDFAWMEDNRAYYSLTKAQAEHAVLAANSESFRTCALRPHLIWGPRDTHLIPRLLARARAGRLRRIGNGANLVDVTYVQNAAIAHLQAAEALAPTPEQAVSTPTPLTPPAPAGKAYFLSQGQPVNCWEWIEEILTLANLPRVKKSVSFQTAHRVGHALEMLYSNLGLRGEPPMTRFLAAQLSRSHWFDISAARRDFGYEPRVSTAEGMQRLADWLKNQR
jgi:nucleoside-diphosphate-sugar epimerase